MTRNRRHDARPQRRLTFAAWRRATSHPFPQTRPFASAEHGDRTRGRLPPAFISSRRRSAISATSRLRALETLAGADLDRLRGHPRHPQAARPLRHRDAAHAYHEHNAATARPKLLARLAGGRRRRAGFGCRNAAHLRPRLQAGARSAARRVIASPRARRVVGARRHWSSRACRPTVFSSRDFCRPKQAARRDAHRELARIPATLVLFESGPRARRRARRSRRRLGRARSRDLPRTDQASRGSPPRHACCARRALCGDAETRGEFVIVIAPPTGRRQTPRRAADSTPCCASTRTQPRQGCGGRASRTPPASPRRTSTGAHSNW